MLQDCFVRIGCLDKLLDRGSHSFVLVLVQIFAAPCCYVGEEAALGCFSLVCFLLVAPRYSLKKRNASSRGV
jgi:hypothetical protein